MARRGRPLKRDHELSVPDLISLGLLATFCPPTRIDAILKETGRLEQRTRLLPSRLVVYYVLAMGLYAGEGYRELYRLLVEGLRSVDPTLPLVVPHKSALSEGKRAGGQCATQAFVRGDIGADGVAVNGWSVVPAVAAHESGRKHDGASRYGGERSSLWEAKHKPWGEERLSAAALGGVG